MSDINGYKEDITTSEPGDVLVGHQVNLTSITVSTELSEVVTVSFADAAATYASASRKFKVTISGPNTLHFTFPNGKMFTNGIVALANGGSVDVSLTYS